MIKSTLHWYELYTTTMTYVVLKLSLYKKYVENKMTNVSQCTVGWFVKNRNVSHIYDNINITIVDIIKKKLGKL